MNGANRAVNRLVLFVVGMVLIALAVGAALQAASADEVHPEWSSAAKAFLGQAWAIAAGWTVSLGATASFAVLPVIAVIVVLAVLVAALVILATRRRGRTRDIMHVSTDGGRTVVDRQVADAVLGAPLLARHDVVAARADGYEIRGRTAIRLAVRVQPGAALDSVLKTADDAIAEWDALSGERQPVVVHLSDRAWRDVLRPRTRQPG